MVSKKYRRRHSVAFKLNRSGFATPVLSRCSPYDTLRPMKILDVPQSGSIAGITSSRNRYGQYRRTRAIPVNPNSTAQNEVRTNLALNSVAWQSLTSTEQEEWSAYADEHPRTDSLGQTIFLSGFQSFVGINNTLRLLGLATVTQPPAGGGGSSATIGDMTSAAGVIEVNVTGTVAANDIMIFASLPKSPGVSFNRDYRYIGNMPVKAAEPAADVDLSSLYFAKFGTILADPKKLFFRFVFQINGIQGNPFDRQVIFVN